MSMDDTDAATIQGLRELIEQKDAEIAELKKAFHYCLNCKRRVPSYVLGNDPHQELGCKVIEINRFPDGETEGE